LLTPVVYFASNAPRLAGPVFAEHQTKLPDVLLVLFFVQYVEQPRQDCRALDSNGERSSREAPRGRLGQVRRGPQAGSVLA
jgi:hypothetical protein